MVDDVFVKVVVKLGFDFVCVVVCDMVDFGGVVLVDVVGEGL